MTIGAGTKLGRYEIRRKIGEGGDTLLYRKVAIKFLSAEVADGFAKR